MYFDLKTYVSVFRRAFREPYQRRRRRLTWALAILFPLLAAWDAVFLALDHVFFPGFRRVEVKTPVFIVGSARSGTTNIQRLLSGDERFSYFRTWQILLPSILQKKIVAWIAGFDRQRLGGALEARLNARQDRALGKARRMHDWRLDGAEEDGFLGLHTFGSGTISVIFPYNRMLEHLSNLDRKATPRQRRRVLRFYDGCVKRQLYFDGGDTILLSKNPGFTSRMRSLLEVYPDLKFICPVRHPYETIPSLVNMLQKGWLAMGADPADVEDAVEYLRVSGIESYRYAFEVLDSLPEGQLRRGALRRPDLPAARHGGADLRQLRLGDHAPVLTLPRYPAGDGTRLQQRAPLRGGPGAASGDPARGALAPLRALRMGAGVRPPPGRRRRRIESQIAQPQA